MIKKRQTFGQYIWGQRLKLTDVVVSSFVESILFTAQFFFIGYAINELIKGSYKGIGVLIGVYVVKIMVAALKNKKHNEAYEYIYNQLLLSKVIEPLNAGMDSSKVSFRSHLLYQIVDFFKVDLLTLFESITRLILILVSLFLLNKMIWGIAIAFSIVVILMFRVRKKSIRKAGLDLALALSEEQQMIHRYEVEKVIEQHLVIEEKNNRWQGIFGSNAIVIEIINVFVLILSLIILVRQQNADAVGSFVMLTYYLMTLGSLMHTIPLIYQRYLGYNAVTEDFFEE